MSGKKNSKILKWFNSQEISKIALRGQCRSYDETLGARHPRRRDGATPCPRRAIWIFPKYDVQSTKSASSKKRRNERDIVSHLPHSEFLAITSTFSGLAILFSVLLGFFGVSNTYATSSINITLSGNVSLNLIKDNSQPVFGTSTEQTATITSDHFTGYTLTIAGSNDTGKLENNDKTRFLTSIDTDINENTFKTDTQYNDHWGFFPGTLYENNTTIQNSLYRPSPTTVGTTIDITDSPTDEDGNEYRLALGAKISPNMALDSYGQTFVLAATGNGYDYHIGFTDDAATLPDDIYGYNPQSNKVTLPTEIPTKSGFVFGGWCSQATVVNTSTHETTCPSEVDVYDPGDEVTLYGNSANNMLFHAIWSKGYDTFADAFAAFGKSQSSGYYQMQDMTSEICNSIIIGSPAITTDIAKNTLIDTRDGTTYLVAKYADGHCWMRQNLSLSLSNNADVIAYNFETDSTFNYRPAYSTQTSTGTAWASDASDGARSYGGDKDKYIGGTDISTTASITTSGQPYEKIGILYNWAAATAQTGAQAAAATTEVSTSICPKGWRLPADEREYSFSVLMGSYSLPTTNQNSTGYSGQLQNPLNFNRPGYYDRGNTLGNRGVSAWFWSSVARSSEIASYLHFSGTSFQPHGSALKGYGWSIRCVAV